jgi:hypothetical protein
MEHNWCQQDGARSRTAGAVLQFVGEIFNSRLLFNRYSDLYGTGLAWPPMSPDLNPRDFYLWDYLKDTVFQKSPRTIPELK